MDRGDERGKENEEALLARARAGEDAAFREIFVRHRNQVYSVAYRMTGDPGDAEDVCQEVFLQAVRRIGGFQGLSKLSTWLYRVTVNRSKDHLRKKKRAPVLLAGDDDRDIGELAPVQTPANDDQPECRVMATEAQRLVQDAIMRLPAGLRAPLVLHEIEGLGYSEVAGLLRIPVGTVKSRIFRARVKLAETLEPHREQWGA